MKTYNTIKLGLRIFKQNQNKDFSGKYFVYKKTLDTNNKFKRIEDTNRFNTINVSAPEEKITNPEEITTISGETLFTIGNEELLLI